MSPELAQSVADQGAGSDVYDPIATIAVSHFVVNWHPAALRRRQGETSPE